MCYPEIRAARKDTGLADWMSKRLAQLEAVLSKRDWLAADRFTVADLIMADVLRVSEVRAHAERPATEAYVARSPPVPRSARLIQTKSRISRRPTKIVKTVDE
jgi:glutathione S-transferase